ncbi:hypothetical protein Clacol_006619 [Clathrus columnatus]|uniref:Uncharacterized protein n=1 Tax=Clathrus columnatus TaxID=1419009 RepID=A0AAV5AFU2_9AGAM|nr:hypothetical protein Clacol_006619 [Clathrus columnatus]
MQQKGVHISSTTLGLRFMQNAKVKQEQRQTEVARVKIQSEEQWHLETPEELGESSKHTDDNAKRPTSQPEPEPNVSESNKVQSQDTISAPKHSPPSKSRSSHKRSAEYREDPTSGSRLKDGPKRFQRPNVEAPKALNRIFEHNSEPARKRKKRIENLLTEHP